MNDYVLVMGLGLNEGGVGVAKYFSERGGRVIVTDLKSENELKPSLDQLRRYKNIELVLGEHRERDFENAKLVIANPGVKPDNKYVQTARKAGVPVHTEMSYFFANKKTPVIGITGTRGKSTTTKLTHKIFTSAGKKMFLGGNIGVSVMELLERGAEFEGSVLEISNNMLEWMRVYEQSPEEALITNIMRDHVLRHGSFEEYISVKRSIFEFQRKSDRGFVNVSDKIARNFVKIGKSEKITFGYSTASPDFRIEDGFIFENGNKLFALESVIEDEFHPLAGSHNELNILGAATIARTHEIELEAIEHAIINYKGLYGRQMHVGRINDIDIINDTCATIPDAVIAALKRFAGQNVILITGGTDKKLKFAELADYLNANPVKAAVVLAGSASEKLLTQLKEREISFPVHAGYKKLEKAVEKGVEVAEPGDLILFSPGGSSFELFANEFARGEQFDEIVKKLKE